MPTPRLDLYAGIHKALRLFMSRTLCELGSTDAQDASALRAALDQLQRLLQLCAQHLKHEEDFVHPALQRAARGALASISADHQHHREQIEQLGAQAAAVVGLPTEQRGAALASLYRALAVFVGENFIHMETEEREHNALLWAHFSDAELLAIEQRLVASIEPATMQEALHWFLPALSTPERLGMLAGMRQGMPAPAFAGVLEIARRTLDTTSHARLLRELTATPAMA